MEPILRYLKAQGKKTVKQLRWWGENLAVCPFLTHEMKCFVYPVRPETCSSFGHIKFPPERAALAEHLGITDMTCPREKTGEAFFDVWSTERIEEFDRRHSVTDRKTRIIPLSLLGQEIKKAIKTGKDVEVPYLTSVEWSMLLNEAKKAWKTNQNLSSGGR